MLAYRTIAVLFIGLFIQKNSFCQTNESILPQSFSYNDFSLDEIVAVEFNEQIPTNTSSILAKNSLPKAGYCLPVDIDLREHATQKNIGGKIVYFTKIKSTTAKGLVPYFDQFSLAEGATLHVYSIDKKDRSGAFTKDNTSPTGFYCTGFINSKEIVFEYCPSSSQNNLDKLHINEMGIATTVLPQKRASREFGDAESCEVNVNCSEGAKYNLEKQAIVRILVKAGADFGWCTGTLINNTNQDCTPYVLAADHCSIADNGNYASNSDFSQWVYYFNYQSPTCTNPVIEGVLANQFITGSTRMAYSNDNGGDTGSDFLLTKLNVSPPALYNAYFAGWNRANTLPDSGACIHHPSADIKKISTYKGGLFTASWGGSVLASHMGLLWVSTANGWGVTEGGSSGSPLFDKDKMVVGTLTGGGSLCADHTQEDFYGRMFYHWDKNGTIASRQLKPWLDPNNTGAVSLAGRGVCGGVSVDEVNVEKVESLVYPNPSNGTFFITTKSYETLTIYSIDGKLVFQTNVPQSVLKITDLATGIYLLKAKTTTGILTQKIVVQ